MDEASLIRSASAGEVSAFDALVEQHAPAILAVARARTGDAALAEEIVQDAFVRLFRHLPRFRGDSSLRTWLVRVVLNLATDARRRDPRRFEAPVDALPDRATSEPSVEDVNVRSEQAARVRNAVLQLSEPLRLAISLRYDAGLSYAEIAEALNVPIGTVASRIAAATIALRSALADERARKRSS
jgi:RNA polymerase sigma-70 factor, ECF subfamily